jgi:TetR/AcrR family transcriptional repressor of mexJK operon
VIFEAAATLFLRHGYLGTSMDEIAALAGVSKQTIYTHFANKEQLFTELVVAGVTDRADRLAAQLPPVPEDIGDLEPYLRELAWPFLTTAVDPKVLQLRRLVIGEVNRFPGLARSYYERSHVRATALLATRLEELSRRGLLPCSDPLLAAHHLAGLVMWMPRNLLTFCPDASFTTSELERLLDSAVRAFLAGYGTP